MRVKGQGKSKLRPQVIADKDKERSPSDLAIQLKRKRFPWRPPSRHPKGTDRFLGHARLGSGETLSVPDINWEASLNDQLKLRKRVVPLRQLQSSSSGKFGTLEALKRDKSAAKFH